MRIISGKFKGRKIFSIDGVKTRPLSNMIQEALFNILRDVEGIDLLEIFAGFGMFSWEALSRGANSSVMVEKDFKVASKLKRTAKALNLEDKVKIIVKDVFKGLKLPEKKFNLIFADPPFGLNLTDRVIELVKNSGWLKENGVFIIRHHDKEEPKEENLENIIYEKKYGDSVIKFYRYE